MKEKNRPLASLLPSVLFSHQHTFLNMKHIAFWVALLLSLCSKPLQSGAQQPEQLPAADSLKLEALIDSIFHAPVYAARRQVFLDSELAIVPHNAYLWQQKAMPLYKMHKYETGKPYLDSAVKYNPVKYLDYRAFMKCIFSKEYREAINDFEAARRLNGNIGVMDHPYDFYEGLCYLQLNMFDSCTWYMDKCITQKTKTAGADWVHPLHWFYKGIAAYEKENFNMAITCFDSALARYPGFSDVQFYKALSLERMGKREDANVVMAEGLKNNRDGKTFNEDNIFYELYPYQVNPHTYAAYAANMAKRKEE